MRIRGVLMLSLFLDADRGGCASMPDIDDEPPATIGFDDASSAGMKPASVLSDEDMENIARRGVELYWMERCLDLAYERGLPRVGKSVNAALMPIATVDEGYHSGGVTFYRWMEEDLDESGMPDPAKARRWLSVPILLRPDRVLELEQFGDEVEENGDIYRRIVAIELAAKAALERHPKGNWSFHTFREERRVKKEGLVRQTRVYLVGHGAPDLEAVVVDDRGRKKPAKVVELRVQQEASAASKVPIRTALTKPGAITVARALALAPVAGETAVQGSDGSRWTVAAETGEIVRVR